MRRLTTYFCALGLALFANAQAETVPGPVKSAAFLEVIATRGLECDLLRPWQASAIRALNLTDMERWSPERRLLLGDEIQRNLEARSCEDESVRVWIDAASRGFDAEMLPPYLVVYRTLVGYEDPPKIFTNTTVRIQYGPAIEAINKKLSELEASGAKPEGGKTWPEYIQRTESAAREFVALLANDEAPTEEREQAAAWVAQTGHIVELWLLDEER